jgi:hypothetical protein
MKRNEKKINEIESDEKFLPVLLVNRVDEKESSRTTDLSGETEVSMSFTEESILIGGDKVDVKIYSSKKSPKMAEVLTKESIVGEAQYKIDQSFSDSVMNKIKGTINAGGGKKSIMGLITTMMSLKPEKAFGGKCDPRIDKGLAMTCLFTNIKEDLPSLITEFMGGDDDDDNNASNNSRGLDRPRGNQNDNASDVSTMI